MHHDHTHLARALLLLPRVAPWDGYMMPDLQGTHSKLKAMKSHTAGAHGPGLRLTSHATCNLKHVLEKHTTE